MTKTAISAHSIERARERLAGTGLDPEAVCIVAARVAAHFASDEVAVRLVTLKRAIGDTSADVMTRQSNGDEVWAICRFGVVATIMLRRSAQPKTPAAFGVRRVTAIAA